MADSEERRRKNVIKTEGFKVNVEEQPAWGDCWLLPYVPPPGARDLGESLLSLSCYSILPTAICPFLCLIFPNLETNKLESQELGFRNGLPQESQEVAEEMARTTHNF